MKPIEQPDLPFKSESFAKAWSEWITYRKERRLPNYVPMGLKKTFTRLVNDSGNSEGEAIKMIEYSMSQNYQGIFKEKINGTHIKNFGTKPTPEIVAPGGYGKL